MQPTKLRSDGSDVGHPSDLSLNASNYLKFCGFISKPTFCSHGPFQAEGKSLNFLALGGS